MNLSEKIIYDNYNDDTVNEYKLMMYENLMDDYIGLIYDLIDSSNKMKILPLKIRFSIGLLKTFIRENKFDVLQNGINYLLLNKETVLNFDITKLDDLDIDTDDNLSIKSCMNEYKKTLGTSATLNEQDEFLNLIIEIKNNSKTLTQIELDIIKKYFELIIITLEQIQNIFN